MKTRSLFGVFVACVAGIVACPGPGGPDWEGHYSVSGSMTITSAGSSNTNVDSGNAEILPGTTANTIVYPMPGNYNGTCNVPLTTSGNTATVSSGFSCTVTYNDGSSATVTFTSGTMVYQTNVIQADAAANVSVVMGGATYTGTMSIHDTLTLVSH